MYIWYSRRYTSEFRMTKPLDGGPVGYRRPPQHSRFRPGQSGNPTGRPKHAPNFRAALLAELSEMIDVAGGAPMSKQDALIRCLVDQAIAGNLRATAALLPVLMQASESQDAENPEPDPDDSDLLDDYVDRKLRDGSASPSGDE
jgi:hypothetical protein